MSLRPIPATNNGPREERFYGGEHSNDELRQTFYGFSALISTWYSAEDEKMIEFSVSAQTDEEERGA